MADVRIRAALPGDTAAMLEITRNVWEGDDYLPFVWRDWLADSRGFLMVAESHAGHVLGLQHIDLQPDGTAWVEGVRVAEEARGKGIGSAMLVAAIEWARAQVCPQLRLATSGDNPASNRIAERAGLAVAGTFISARGLAVEGPAKGASARVVSAVAFEDVVAFLRAVMPASRRDWLYTEGWTAYSLNDGRLRLLLARQQVICSGDGGIEGMAIATANRSRPSLRLGLLHGSTEAMGDLCHWARAAARSGGLARVGATVAEREGAAQALDEAGFITGGAHRMILHELRLR